MQRLFKKSLFSRFLKVALAVLMIVTLVPMNVMAENNTLTTDKTEYLPGEPIYVNASSNIGGAWVGLYDKGGSEGAYWFYYYVSESNGVNRNIYHSTSYDASKTDGVFLAAGEYDVVLYDAGYGELDRKTISIVEPESTSTSIELGKEVYNVGDTVAIKPVSYNNGAWVAVYSGNYSAGDDLSGASYSSNWWHYVAGVNHGWLSFPAPAAGDYTAVVFKDGGYTVDVAAQFTVTESQVSLLETDKEIYKYGESVMVKTNYSGSFWVGMYEKGLATDGSVASLFWYDQSAGANPFNIIGSHDESGRPYYAGEYTLVLFSGSGYDCVATVDITIEAVETSRETISPTCEEDGKIVISYNDGSFKTLTAEDDPSLKATGHTWEKLTEGYGDNGVYQHVCNNGEAHYGNCTFDEGVVTIPPSEGTTGVKTRTCTECSGTKEEPYAAVHHEEVIEDSTCLKAGSKKVFYTESDYYVVEIPVKEHVWSDWRFDEETKTHSRICNENILGDVTEGHTESKSCDFKNPIVSLSDNKVTSTCECGGTLVEPVLSTDKKEYAWKEPVNVTLNPAFEGSSAWVGLYKDGETYNPDAGGVRSIYWYYQSEQASTVNILATRDENSRSSEYVQGKYKVVLFNNDSYTAEIAVTFDVVAAETSREVISATCEEDGKIIISYEDGTTKTITAAEDESLKATGHDWNKTQLVAGKYVHTCKTDEEHVEECTFDQGVVTTPAEGAEPGEKTFTCSVCEGTRTEVYYNTVYDTEIIKEATCLADGIQRNYVTEDKTQYYDTVISKTNAHVWSDWTFDEETKTHSRICNENILGDVTEGHTESGECSFKAVGVENGTATFECETCKGTYDLTIIKTDKTEYGWNEPVRVTINYPDTITDRYQWVGLNKKGDTPGVPYNESFYWNYLSALELESFVMNSTDNAVTDGTFVRWPEYAAGDYVITVFSTDGYEVLASVDIKFTADVLTDVLTPATCLEDGKEVITYEDGTTLTITKDKEVHAYSSKPIYKSEVIREAVVSRPELEATGHDWNKTQLVAGEYVHSCKNDEAHTEECTFDEGVVTIPAVGSEPGEKTFTCSVCEGTRKEVYYVNVDHEKVIKPATCLENGILRHYLIEDETAAEADNQYFDTVINKLANHVWSDWTFNESNRTHTRICDLNKYEGGPAQGHAETEDCSFKLLSVNGNTATYQCETCKGTYEGSILQLNKTEFTSDEPILVTAACENEGSWVGLYHVDDKYDPNNGGVVSYYWYTVTEGTTIQRSGVQQNLKDYRNIDRSDLLTTGTYEVVLFGDGGYTNVLAREEITITAVDTTATEFTVKLNNVEYQDGDVVEYPEGTIVRLNVSAEGPLGESWVGIYHSPMDKEVDFSGVPSNAFRYLYEINNEDWVLNGESLPGKYSIGVFGDGGYSDCRMVINFEIKASEESVTVLEEPTCTIPGVQHVVYKDGSDAYLPIEPLGHLKDNPTYSYDKDHHEHTYTCARCLEPVKEDCEFDDGVVIKHATNKVPGEKLFTCEICEGTYVEEFESTEPIEPEVNRIEGATRYETSLSIADTLKAELGVVKFDNIIVASGENFPDALSGSYLSSVKNAPILIVNTKSTSSVKSVQDYIKENLAESGTVYVLGGKSAVSDKLEAGLGGYNVKRLAGDTRYETNLKILKEAGVSGGTMIVATGKAFADSLSASALGLPILMVDKKLTQEQKEFLASANVEKLYIIGGENAVNTTVESVLRGIAPTVRLGGKTRYETSVMVAETFFELPEQVVLAVADKFPDGLCGGPLAQSMNAPVILTKAKNTNAAAEYATSKGIVNGYVLGGTKALSEETVNQILKQ